MKFISTFSLVAKADNGDLGVAVASKLRWVVERSLA